MCGMGFIGIPMVESALIELVQHYCTMDTRYKASPPCYGDSMSFAACVTFVGRVRVCTSPEGLW